MPEQTMTAKAKVVNLSDQDALTLGLLGFSATKLWNTANWKRRGHWKETGKIPSGFTQERELKDNIWYRRLHSQSAQAILEELDRSYRSWFAHRKNGNKDMRPPGFRKKETLSTVTFKKSAVYLRGNSLRLSIPKRVYSGQFVHLKLAFPPGVMVGGAQMVRLIFDEKKGEWFAHVVHKIEVPEPKKEGHITAIDVGMKVFAASVGTDGKTFLYSGGELRAIDRYFAKKKVRCKSANWKPRSRKKRASKKEKELNRKWGAQRRHFLHSLTKTIVDDAEARKTSTIVLGDLNGIRKGKSWGKNGNQKLHAWPFDRFKEILTYKAALKGIKVEQISERGSSSMCSACGKKEPRKGAGRKTRGRYVCPFCGTDMQADVNGAANILKMYLREEAHANNGGVSSGVVAALARPAVNRFVWRDTTPKVHEAGMPKQGVWAFANSFA